MAASEALQVDDEHGRNIVDLDLLHGLLMIQTPIAVPCVRLGQLLRSVELSEAVVNADAFGEFFAGVGLTKPLKLAILVVDKPIEARVERPALFMVELDQQLKLKVVALLLLLLITQLVRAASLPSAALASLTSLLRRSLLILLRRFGLFSMSGLGSLTVLLEVEVWLGGDTGFIQDLLQRNLIFKLQRTALALHPTAVDAGHNGGSR